MQTHRESASAPPKVLLTAQPAWRAGALTACREPTLVVPSTSFLQSPSQSLPLPHQLDPHRCP